MAKATKKKWASQKPIRSTRKRKQPAAEERLMGVARGTPEPEPQPEPEPETKEDIIKALNKLCDDVDAELADEADRQERADNVMRPPRDFGWSNTEPWGDWYRRRSTLRSTLEDLLETGTDEVIEVDSILRPALTVTEPGVIPSLARPGTFVMWIGWCPVLVSWGGYVNDDIHLSAVDPDRPWMEPGGSSLIEYWKVLSEDKTPYDVCRRLLSQMTAHKQVDNRGKKPPAPTFKLVPMTREARDEAGARLAEQPWLRTALKRGPVDAIPIPRHIKSVQMAMA